MRCSACGFENPQEAKFCLECGKPLAFACPNCGTALPPHAKYCGQRGIMLTPPAQTEPIATVRGPRRRRQPTVLAPETLSVT
jgi:predicted amidophosphoribosyltransferase